MEDLVVHKRTLGQLLEHNIQDNPGNIVIPNVPNFKLNPVILNVLPVFEGLKHENPYTHLASLHRKCTSLFGNIQNLDNINLTLFSHTLGDAPRDWLNHLQGGLFKKEILSEHPNGEATKGDHRHHSRRRRDLTRVLRTFRMSMCFLPKSQLG